MLFISRKKTEATFKTDILKDIPRIRKISRIFSRSLNCNDGTHPQVIQIIIDMLDMLRRHTEHLFLAGFKEKILTQHSLKDWRGRPYGVVCVLSGILELAKSYLKRKDVTSALYCLVTIN